MVSTYSEFAPVAEQKKSVGKMDAKGKAIHSRVFILIGLHEEGYQTDLT